MGVKMSTPETMAVLDKLLPASSQAKKKLTQLTSAGYKVSFGLFQFVINSPTGQVFQDVLPKMYSQLPNASEAEKNIGITKITAVIEAAFLHMASGGAAQVVEEAAPAPVVQPVKTGKAPAFAKVAPPVAEKVAAAVEKEVGDANTPIPVAAVIPLAQAKAIGQKVSGTSATAIYRACAIGKANFACKITGTTLSVRVEPKKALTAAEQANLAALKFSDQGTYMSIHVTLGKIPALRVLGALLFSTGLLFKQIATTEAQINA